MLSMPTNQSIILLDSMVVAGIYALTKKGVDIDERKNTYKSTVTELVNLIDNKSLICVPTPVCFELMCWNKEWRNFVLNSDSPLFYFAKHSITNDVLLQASLFSIESNTCKYDEKVHKIKSLDAIIAAYSLINTYYVLTENQSDFPESHFQLVGTRMMLLKQKDEGVRRVFLHLLKPKQS